MRLIEKEDARHGGGATITRSGDELKFTGGGLTSLFSRAFVDLDLRVAARDKQGVDMHAFYATCEERRWPIYLHPMDPIGMPRTKKYYLINLCGNPYDSGIAARMLNIAWR